MGKLRLLLQLKVRRNFSLLMKMKKRGEQLHHQKRPRHQKLHSVGFGEVHLSEIRMSEKWKGWEVNSSSRHMKKPYQQKAAEQRPNLDRKIITAIAIMRTGKEMPGEFMITELRANFTSIKRTWICLPANQTNITHTEIPRAMEHWKVLFMVYSQRKTYLIQMGKQVWFTEQTTWLQSRRQIRMETRLFLQIQKPRDLLSITTLVPL